jgi:hypothetical protein
MNKLRILHAALIEKFPENLWRSAKAGNGDVVSTIQFSSPILTPEHKQMAIIPKEKPPIPGCIVYGLSLCIFVI